MDWSGMRKHKGTRLPLRNTAWVFPVTATLPGAVFHGPVLANSVFEFLLPSSRLIECGQVRHLTENSMSTETISNQEQLPTSLIHRVVGAALVGTFLLGLLYLVVCIVSTMVLGMIAGLTETDAQQASFLSFRMGLGYHGFVFGTLFVIFGVLNVLRGSTLGLIMAVLGFVGILATSERVALQQGILDGDLKIGCYSYESLECRTMLKVPTLNAHSIYNTPSELSGAGYADWYTPIRAKSLSESQTALPNTMPGVAFLKSPITLIFHRDELKAKIAAQRAEVAQFQASFD